MALLASEHGVSKQIANVQLRSSTESRGQGKQESVYGTQNAGWELAVIWKSPPEDFCFWFQLVIVPSGVCMTHAHEDAMAAALSWSVSSLPRSPWPPPCDHGWSHSGGCCVTKAQSSQWWQGMVKTKHLSIRNNLNVSKVLNFTQTLSKVLNFTQMISRTPFA